MGATSIPATMPKTSFSTTLTSGTSYTVPADVSYLNVTLYGGGGGSGGVTINSAANATAGGTGGTTTFTGATSALGGVGSSANNPGLGGSSNTMNIGLAPTANSSLGALGPGVEGTAIPYANFYANDGFFGQIIKSTLAVSPGASIAYAIGAGGTAGAGGTSGVAGAAGGSGRIDVEYWV